jgi:Ca2+-binding EF-hand superfamily protein
MKKRVPFIAAASAIVLTTSLAVAEEYASTFEQLDVDGDRYISAEEAKARPNLSDNMQASDLDGDGKLNITEFSAFEGKGRFTPPEESEVAEPGAAPY